MAKVGNEAKLIISLFKERAKTIREVYEKDKLGSRSWAGGIVKGLTCAEEVLNGITDELEKRV